VAGESLRSTVRAVGASQFRPLGPVRQAKAADLDVRLPVAIPNLAIPYLVIPYQERP